MCPAFDRTFTHVIESLTDDGVPEVILDHRVHELLLWLQLAGVSHREHVAATMAERLRLLFEGDLTRPWKAPEAARELGMSEATLRRALNREETSFTGQLRDARVSFALMRLQTTNESLAAVAYESGFSSQSRLSEAFKTRFDLTPGKIRSKSTALDRIA